MAARRNYISAQVLFAWFTLAGLALLFAPQSWTTKFQLAFAYIFRLPISAGRTILLSATVEPDSADLVSRTKYNKLQNHLANIMEWLRQERLKVQSLSGLRERTAWQGVKFVLADVITNSADGSGTRAIINRGRKDGLAVDQFVLADYSVAGVVGEVDSRTALVRLITDPACKIPVKIAEGAQLAASPQLDRKAEAATMMQGSGDNFARIRLLPATHKVQPGSVVYARKKPGLLDTAMVVGTVDECVRDHENPLLWDITVKPACELDRLTEVAVVVMNPRR